MVRKSQNENGADFRKRYPPFLLFDKPTELIYNSLKRIIVQNTLNGKNYEAEKNAGNFGRSEIRRSERRTAERKNLSGHRF